MITIYIAQKPLIISNELDEVRKKDFLERQLIVLNNPAAETLPGLLDTFSDESIHGYVWESANPDKVFQMVAAHYEHWEAAGGVVRNQVGEILLMFRRSHWDLPKGKLDPGETPEVCALREITEETGLSHIQLGKKLTETWHTYPLGDKNILKQTYWFEVAFDGDELTVPQIEEDIVDIQWIRPENIKHYMKYAYPGIRDVLYTARASPVKTFTRRNN